VGTGVSEVSEDGARGEEDRSVLLTDGEVGDGDGDLPVVLTEDAKSDCELALFVDCVVDCTGNVLASEEVMSVDTEVVLALTEGVDDDVAELTGASVK